MLEKDLVLERNAVGDDKDVDLLVGGRSVLAVTIIRATNNCAVRCVVADFIIAGPDDFVGDQLDI